MLSCCRAPLIVCTAHQSLYGEVIQEADALLGRVQSNMADKASQTPQDRMGWVEQSFKDSGLDTDPAAKAWGMKIDSRMSQVPVPSLQCSVAAAACL